jgi:hypothetical protein
VSLFERYAKLVTIQTKDWVGKTLPALKHHFEMAQDLDGDLLSGSKNSYIATLVERHTRYVMLAKVAKSSRQRSYLVSCINRGPGIGAGNSRIIDDLH